MRLRVLSAALLAVGIVASVSAAPFTPGNLLVYRVGDGSGPLVNTGNTVFIDEYTTGGALVQSVNVSAASTGGFLASGTATSEGLMTISPNGQFVTLSGYNTASSSASLAGTTSTAVPRSFMVMGINGLVSSQTNLTDFASGNNPRSGVTTNGTDLWVSGAANGISYTTTGSTTSVQLSTTVTNLRQANVFGGQLYVSTSSGTAVRLGAVGTGTPTTSGQTIVNLPGIPTTGSPYAFYLADLDAGVAGLDTAYLTDDTASTITKFSLVGGTWTSNGTATATAIRGLTASVTGGVVSLFGSTGGSAATGGGSLYSLTDATGYNGAFSGSVATIATAGTNTAFRGIAYVPAAVPEPASMAVLGLGVLAALRRRRASK